MALYRHNDITAALLNGKQIGFVQQGISIRIGKSMRPVSVLCAQAVKVIHDLFRHQSNGSA
jgi:hypothetical protein